MVAFQETRRMKTSNRTLLASVGLAPPGYPRRLTARSRQRAEWSTEPEDRFAKHHTKVERWTGCYDASVVSIARQEASTATAKAEHAVARP